MRQLFFLDGKLLGEAPRTLLNIHGEAQEPTSDLYFCQRCGVIYANLPVLHPNGRNTSYQSHRGLCHRCTGGHIGFHLTPGSLWREWDTPFLQALPLAVLQRELLLHLDHLERYQNDWPY